MHKIFLIGIAVCIGSTAFSQINDRGIFLSDIKGQPLTEQSTVEMEGSPFFANDYMTGKLVMNNKMVYDKLPLKVNLLDNSIHFRYEGREMITNAPISQVVLIDENKGKQIIFESGYPEMEKLKRTTLLQVVDTGAIKLLKHTIVTYNDIKGYSSATPIRQFVKKDIYYAFHNKTGQMLKLEKDNTDMLLKLLSDKKDKVNQFIGSKNLRLRNADELMSLVRFYNNL